MTRLVSQGYKVNRLSNKFKTFYGRHTDLVIQYKKNVCQMFGDFYGFVNGRIDKVS